MAAGPLLKCYYPPFFKGRVISSPVNLQKFLENTWAALQKTVPKPKVLGFYRLCKEHNILHFNFYIYIFNNTIAQNISQVLLMKYSNFNCGQV